MASSFKDLNNTVTEIRNNLVCQVCEDPVRPGKRQWYRCLNLHQICQECKGWEKCSCDQPISLEYCKIIEQLLSVGGLKFNCINTKYGCKEAFKRNDLGNHESSCIYREVPCLYDALQPDGFNCSMIGDNCDLKITFHEVIKHYVKEHLEDDPDDFPYKFLPYVTLSWIETCSMSRSGENSFYDPFECTLDDQTFLYCGKTADKLVYRWVYILGSPMEAKKFSYTLKLYGTKGAIFFDGKVAAIDESFDTLFEAGDKCFAIPHKVLMAQYVDEDNYHSYSLDIHNLEEEVKDENNDSGI